MKTFSIILLFTMFMNSVLYSQDQINAILGDIEKNNTTLSYLRYNAEAQKIGNKTDIFLPNPETGFNYLLGFPSSNSNRIDFVVKQSFEYPTVYRYKSKIANIKNDQASLEYNKYLREIMLKAKLICNEIIYLNGMKLEFEKRYENARQIAGSYKSLFDNGEANILDFNKANLNLLNIGKELEYIDIRLSTELNTLKSLNGGHPVEVSVSAFDEVKLPECFELWTTENKIKDPELEFIRQEYEIAKNQIELNKAMNLPKFDAGLMGELVKGEQYIGSTVGISIPLWENRNKVNFAKANAVSIESLARNIAFQRDENLKLLFAKAQALKKNLEDYKSSLSTMDNTALLKKALDKGEISMIEYLMELSLFYDSYLKMLELQRDLNNTVVELYQYR